MPRRTLWTQIPQIIRRIPPESGIYAGKYRQIRDPLLGHTFGSPGNLRIPDASHSLLRILLKSPPLLSAPQGRVPGMCSLRRFPLRILLTISTASSPLPRSADTERPTR
jgi:hypothetical protein